MMNNENFEKGRGGKRSKKRLRKGSNDEKWRERGREKRKKCKGKKRRK